MWSTTYALVKLLTQNPLSVALDVYCLKISMKFPYSNCSERSGENGIHEYDRKDDFLSQGNEVSISCVCQDKDVGLWGDEDITVD